MHKFVHILNTHLIQQSKLTSRCLSGVHFCLLLHSAANSLDGGIGLVILNDTTLSHSLSGLAQDRAKEACKLGGVTFRITLDVLFVASRLTMLYLYK